MTDLQGRRLGDFEIVERIGAGAMGDVYAATQRPLGRKVALKVLPPELARDPQFMSRFQLEVRAAASIQHPGIVQVYSAGETEGIAWYAMEFVDGRDLRACIREGERITLRRAAEIGRGVALALQAAAEAGYLHRDIKPSNIMLDRRGNVRLMDFGLARATDGSSRMTRSGSFIGTPYYVAPEQGMGESVDIRSDLYSLGVVLYEMVTGRVPFDGDTHLSIVYKHAHAAPTPVREIAPHVPETLSDVIHRLLEKAPGARYQTPNELIQALDRAVEQSGRSMDLPVGPSPNSATVVRPPQRRRALTSLSVASAILLGTAVISYGLGKAIVALRPPAGGGSRSPEEASTRPPDRLPSGPSAPAAGEPLPDTGRSADRGTGQGAADPDVPGNTAETPPVGPAPSPSGGNPAPAGGAPGGGAPFRLQPVVASDFAPVRQPVTTLRGHTDKVVALAFSHDGRFLSTGGASADRTFRLWSIPDWAPVVTSEPHWDAAFRVGGVSGLGFSPDDRMLVSGSFDGNLRFFDVPTGSPTFTFKAASMIMAMAVEPTGRWVATGDQRGYVNFYRLAPEEQEPAGICRMSAEISALAFSWDGRLLASGDANGHLQLWSAMEFGSPPERRADLVGHGDGVFKVAFSRDEQWIVSVGLDETVRLWGYPDGRSLGFARPHGTADINAVAVSPRDALIATGSDDGTVKLLTLPDLSVVATLRGHSDWILDLAFSPDGRYLASASKDRTVAIWEMPARRQ